jgi:hypothetical protein
MPTVSMMVPEVLVGRRQAVRRPPRRNPSPMPNTRNALLGNARVCREGTARRRRINERSDCVGDSTYAVHDDGMVESSVATPAAPRQEAIRPPTLRRQRRELQPRRRW